MTHSRTDIASAKEVSLIYITYMGQFLIPKYFFIEQQQYNPMLEAGEMSWDRADSCEQTLIRTSPKTPPKKLKTFPA